MFNILIVEDDKNLKKLINITLTREKYTVYEASNGEEALDILDKNYIDLVISDVMPEMDGFELIKELRSCKYKMPILIITAKDRIEDKLIEVNVDTTAEIKDFLYIIRRGILLIILNTLLT